MDTQNLKAFLSVAEYRSFSEAAAALHLTQPAVSKRIATLEQQLGCRLFDRIGRTVSLTEAGHALLPRAQGILQEVTDTQRLMADLSGNISGNLSVATSHHIGLHRLPYVLQEFSQRYPQVRLELEFLDSEKAYGAVLHGRFDLAVITLAPTQDKMLQSRLLWTDPLQFVCAANHPLLRSPLIELSDLTHFAAILPSLNTYTTTLVKDLFDERQLPLNLTMPTNYLETIKMMVSIGLGWSVLPETIIDKQLAKLQVTDKHIPITITRQLGCIYHRERTLSNAGNAFLHLLQASDHTQPTPQRLQKTEK